MTSSLVITTFVTLSKQKKNGWGHRGVVLWDPEGLREEWNWGGQAFPRRQRQRFALLPPFLA